MTGQEAGERGSPERRRAARLPVAEISNVKRGGKPTSITVLDMSETGACFEASEMIPADTVIEMLITYQPLTFPLPGLVVWSRESEGEFLHGVEFVNVAPGFKLMLKDYLGRIEGH